MQDSWNALCTCKFIVPAYQTFSNRNEKFRNRETSRGHSRDTTQADVTNYILAGKDRCSEIAAASTSGVPSPACCDITCLPPHNHDESLWGLLPTKDCSHRHNSEWQWQPSPRHAVSLFIFLLFQLCCSHFFISFLIFVSLFLYHIWLFSSALASLPILSLSSASSSGVSFSSIIFYYLMKVSTLLPLSTENKK